MIQPHQENNKTLDFAYFALKSLETLENPFQGISRGPRGSRDEFISERVLKPLGNFSPSHAFGIFLKFTQDAQEHPMGQANLEVSGCFQVQ